VAGTVPEPPPPRSVAGASVAATQKGESLDGMGAQAREHSHPQSHAYTEEERRLALELKEKRRMLMAKQQLSTQSVPVSSVGAPLVTNVPSSQISDVSFRTSYPSAMPEFSKVSPPLSPPAGSSPREFVGDSRDVNSCNALNAAPDYGIAHDEGGREAESGGREVAAAAAGRGYDEYAEDEHWRAAQMPRSHAHEVMRPPPPLGGGAASAGSSPRQMGARSPIGVPLPPPRPVHAFPEDRGDEDPILHPITGDPILRQVNIYIYIYIYI
jgi:hypothetical protein